MIVGFPGETEEEFEITEKYLEKVHFYECMCLNIPEEQGTKAAAMPDQIQEQEKGLVLTDFLSWRRGCLRSLEEDF